MTTGPHDDHQPFRNIDPLLQGRGPVQERGRVTQRQWKLAGMIVLATLGSLLAWGVSEVGLGESGFYFIAIPGGLAAAITLLPNDEDGMMGPYRAAIVVILSSALLVREGLICVLMASPLIFLVIAIVVTVNRRRDRLGGFVLVPLLLLGALEGIAYELPRESEVVETRIINSTADEIDAALSSPGDLPDVQPLLFKLPFPKPLSFDGVAAEIGDRQRVTFDMGHIDLEVIERSAGHARLIVIDDTTPIANWYAVETVTIDWVEIHPGQTELAVRIEYRRGLDPAVYFDPLGRFGVGEMAEVLADMIEVNR